MGLGQIERAVLADLGEGGQQQLVLGVGRGVEQRLGPQQVEARLAELAHRLDDLAAGASGAVQAGEAREGHHRCLGHVEQQVAGAGELVEERRAGRRVDDAVLGVLAGGDVLVLHRVGHVADLAVVDPAHAIALGVLAVGHVAYIALDLVKRVGDGAVVLHAGHRTGAALGVVGHRAQGVGVVAADVLAVDGVLGERLGRQGTQVRLGQSADQRGDGGFAHLLIHVGRQQLQHLVAQLGDLAARHAGAVEVGFLQGAHADGHRRASIAAGVLDLVAGGVGLGLGVVGTGVHHAAFVVAHGEDVLAVAHQR
ncbi:hypothetical protein D3C86_1071720 [compost metagenome]